MNSFKLIGRYEMNDINALLTQEFYGWWQFAVCTFAFVALFSIWWHIGKKQNDLGQVWLALSVLCWGILGAVEVFYANFLIDKDSLPVEVPLQLQGWRSILSLCNSFFILLALPWFRYIPNRLVSLVKSKHWYYIIGLPFLFSLLPMLSIIITGKSNAILSELDLYYAFFTLMFLGVVLYESFAQRRLKLLAYLSVICILVTLIGQVLKLSGEQINMMLVSAIFKSCLIMLFFALALSWVKDLIEDKSILPGQLKMTLSKVKNEKGRFENWVQIQGIPGMYDSKAKLTRGPYELLNTFVQRQKTGDNWLEIKPKSDKRSSKIYDIQDHNEIKRLLEGLLDGIYGKGNWEKGKHYEPLKRALFENSENEERKIKLKLPVQNTQVLH